MPFANDEWDEESTETEAVPAELHRSGVPSLVVLTGADAGESYVLGAGETVVVGRGGDARIRVPGQGVSRVHCLVRRGADGVELEDPGSRNGTYVNGERVTRAVLREGDKILVGRTVFRFGYQDRLDASYQRRLYEAAIRDDLTGAYNKRYFRERLEVELAFAKRHAAPLSLLLLDIDHYKTINDERGHVFGDEVLSQFCAQLRAVLRRGDELARIGGDEFAVCARATPPDEALTLAERMRGAVAEHRVRVGSQELSLTTSIGVATFPRDPVDTVGELMAVADRALYRAKQGGRNRVEATR